MTHAEKLAILRKWKDAHDRGEAVAESLEPIFGRYSHEGEVVQAMWDHFDLTTELVALILGDKGGWCSWYALENNFGRKGMEAGPPGNMRKITSPSRLLWLIGATA